jgi:predicted permease
LLRDARFGLRMLRKHAIVSAAAVVSLSLAIGACTAAFSLIDALILRPLPVSQPEQLRYLTYDEQDNQGRPEEWESFSLPGLARLRAAAAPSMTLFGVSYLRMRSVVFARTADSASAAGEPERLRTQYLTGDAMPQLGLRPALGRLLTMDDDRKPGQHPVAVISHRLWMRRFDGAADVLGRWLTLDGQTAVQIVGVGPQGFTGVEPGRATDLWLPAMMWPEQAVFTGDGYEWLRLWGRLQPGAAPEAVEARLQADFTASREAYVRGRFTGNLPAERIKRFIETPLHLRSAANGPSPLRRDLERPLWILALVAGLVLLIACSNVANLMMARAAAREREMALRASLGAGRARLVQQVLVESGLLAAASSLLGLLVARASAPAIVALLSPAEDPAYLDAHIDWRVLAFTGIVGVLTMVLFGLAPAWRAKSVAPIEALKSGGGRQSGSARMFRPLIAAQIGVSGVVLFLAGLFLLSFQRITQVDPGFAPDGVLLVSIDAKDRAGDPSQIGPALPRLREEVRALPGIDAAGVSSTRFFGGGGWRGSVRLPGGPPDARESLWIEVTPGFFETMRIPLLGGRDFTAHDGDAAQPSAAIVNEAFARQYFPGENPIGKRFSRVLPRQLVPQEIVGVVRATKYSNLRETPLPAIYLPFSGTQGGTLAVRTSLDAASAVTLLRGALPRVDAGLRVTSVTRQTMLIENTLIRERLLALLSGFFALVALVLAAVGLYGVLSYAVIQRTREIGIRLALGARRARVARVVLADVTLVTLIGLAAGLSGGLLLARWVSALLFEVRPTDLGSLAWPAACLAVAALLAAVPPAWRAARVDPLVALRWE